MKIKTSDFWSGLFFGLAATQPQDTTLLLSENFKQALHKSLISFRKSAEQQGHSLPKSLQFPNHPCAARGHVIHQGLGFAVSNSFLICTESTSRDTSATAVLGISSTSAKLTLKNHPNASLYRQLARNFMRHYQAGITTPPVQI